MKKTITAASAISGVIKVKQAVAIGPPGPPGQGFNPPVIAYPAQPTHIFATESPAMSATMPLPRTGDSWLKITLTIAGSSEPGQAGVQWLIRWRIADKNAQTFHTRAGPGDDISGASLVFLVPVTGSNVSIELFGTSLLGNTFPIFDNTSPLPTSLFIEDLGPR